MYQSGFQWIMLLMRFSHSQKTNSGENTDFFSLKFADTEYWHKTLTIGNFIINIQKLVSVECYDTTELSKILRGAANPLTIMQVWIKSINVVDVGIWFNDHLKCVCTICLPFVFVSTLPCVSTESYSFRSPALCLLLVTARRSGRSVKRTTPRVWRGWKRREREIW